MSYSNIVSSHTVFLCVWIHGSIYSVINHVITMYRPKVLRMIDSEVANSYMGARLG